MTLVKRSTKGSALTYTEMDDNLTHLDLYKNVQNITGPGAISLTESVTLITTTGADAYTLADGVEGQIKIISMKVDGGDAIVTPDNLVGYTSVTLNNVKDNFTLLYQSTGWVITALQAATKNA
jgi:N-acetylmuramoyl-L-alanine amidase CwlA